MELYNIMLLVDCHGSDPLDTTSSKRLTLHQGAETPEDLPSSIFLVDRLVTTRPSKTHKVSIYIYAYIGIKFMINNN